VIAGCEDGRAVNYEYSEGDLKLTITRDYIIIDSCTGFNRFGQAYWIHNKTINRSDSVACSKLLERLLKK
jgi:hypothetical protein